MKQQNLTRISVAATLGALLTLTLAGCPGGAGGTQNSTGSSTLAPFTSSGDMLDYFKQQASAQSSRSFFSGTVFAPTVETLASADAGASSASPPSFSTTNIQEQGVDESDVVKSDGTYFYIAKDSSLRIVRAFPPEALAQVGRVDLAGFADQMYLFGNHVLLLSQDVGSSGGAEILIYPPYRISSSVTLYDISVSDPANPFVVSQTTLDGALVSSRLIDNRISVVLTETPVLPTTLSGIATVTLDSVLPQVHNDAGDQPIADWDRFLRPSIPDGYVMTLVVTLDASNVQNIVSTTGIMGGAGTIYASPQALYVTDSDFDPNANFRESTSIHKLAFGEDGGTTYVASGLVPGRLLNQFSLSEQDGLLRVATSVTNFQVFPAVDLPVVFSDTGNVGGPGPAGAALAIAPISTPQQYNAVYVLSQNSEQLVVTGQITNIAPGEKLYAARFIGDNGFLVTFRQIDPLFAIDLSDPAAPTVVGELKVPGFSDYLHPLDDTHLIGIGRSIVTIDGGFVEPGGVQVSLFDVSNLAAPTLVQQLTLGGFGSSSDVSQTHKAFTFLPESNLMAIPVVLQPDPNLQTFAPQTAFDGVVVFQTSPGGFTELTRVPNVVDLAQPLPTANDGSPGSTIDPAVPGFSPSFFGFISWRRAAFINNEAYALTNFGVAAQDLANTATTTTLTLGD